MSGSSHGSLLCTAGTRHPTRGLRASSPIVLSAERLLSCPFPPHTPMTSSRQHEPRGVVCSDHLTSVVPEGALGGGVSDLL